MKTNFGICFSRPFEGNDPLGHIGIKEPVYKKLLELCQKEGWGVYVLTRKTYKGDGVFGGAWKLLENGKFEQVFDDVKIAILYDRTAGVKFPPQNDSKMKVV